MQFMNLKNTAMITVMAAGICCTGSQGYAAENVAPKGAATATADQRALAQRLPQTVVVRISNATGAAEVLETSTALKADASSLAAVKDQTFKAADLAASTKASGQNTGELDGYVSRDSWYRCWNYYGGNWGGYWNGGWGNRWGGYGYYPSYNYYGYNYYYQPYYSYYNAGYSYYYYGWY
jgi:hypothetical protein